MSYKTFPIKRTLWVHTPTSVTPKQIEDVIRATLDRFYREEGKGRTCSSFIKAVVVPPTMGYAFVSCENEYNLMLGLNEDGSERISYETDSESESESDEADWCKVSDKKKTKKLSPLIVVEPYTLTYQQEENCFLGDDSYLLEFSKAEYDMYETNENLKSLTIKVMESNFRVTEKEIYDVMMTFVKSENRTPDKCPKVSLTNKSQQVFKVDFSDRDEGLVSFRMFKFTRNELSDGRYFVLSVFFHKDRTHRNHKR